MLLPPLLPQNFSSDPWKPFWRPLRPLCSERLKTPRVVTWSLQYGPLKGDPLYTAYILDTTQGPVLQNPLKKIRDHIQGPMKLLVDKP